MPYATAPDTPLRRERRQGLRSPATAWSLVFAAVLAGGLFASEPPRATAPRAASVQVVQQVVQQQLQALSAHDATRAFALADPELRTQFGTADSFLQTVRDEYPMLMQPASVLFLKPESDGTVAMQKVRITDVEGSSWSLTYLLNRQQDNQWRISGCLVTPEGKQILT